VVAALSVQALTPDQRLAVLPCDVEPAGDFAIEAHPIAPMIGAGDQAPRFTGR
jgi:hypothetical protein